jgi:hypothetical protein
VLFDIPDCPSVIYDFYGYFEPPASDPAFLSNDYLHLLPSFIALSAIEVKFLTPCLSNVPPAPILRQHCLDFFSLFLDPLPAELLLLWLVGRSRSHAYLGLPMGLISLNFFGCDPAVVHTIIELLSFLCTTLNIVQLSAIDNDTIRPARVDGEMRETFLSSARDTRIIVDETVSVPPVSATGEANLGILQGVVSSQTFQFDSEGDLFDQFTSFPVLILSNEPSVLRTNVSIPIGGVREAVISVEPELLTLMRVYVDQIRFSEWELDDDGAGFVAEQLAGVRKADGRVGQEEMHLVMFLDELNCVSLGRERSDLETWGHSLELLVELLNFKREE